MSDGPSGDQPGIYYNLRENEMVFISQYRCGLTTLSDSVVFELGFTNAINGGGTFRPATCEYHLATGAVVNGIVPPYFVIDPPLCLRYSQGVRSITMRVQANDAGATITVAYHGWVENE